MAALDTEYKRSETEAGMPPEYGPYISPILALEELRERNVRFSLFLFNQVETFARWIFQLGV